MADWRLNGEQRESSTDILAPRKHLAMDGTVSLITDDDLKHLDISSTPFYEEEDSIVNCTFAQFHGEFPPTQQQEPPDFTSHLSASSARLGFISDFVNPVPNAPHQNDYIQHAMLQDSEISVPTVLPPHFSQENTATSFSRKRFKPTPVIHKPSAHRPNTLTGHIRKQQRDTPNLHLHAPTEITATPSCISPASSPEESDAKRLQHNKMMRESRERANSKFHALEALLVALSPPDLPMKPVKNKMQILDRVMLQYRAMLARKASLRTELVLATCSESGTGEGLRTMLSGSLMAACETVARIAIGMYRWKYAEVYTATEGDYMLSAALVSPGNLQSTCEKLEIFSGRQLSSSITTRIIRTAAKLGTSMWVPDVRDAASGVSTALFVPVVLQTGKMADAVIALFHVDDEVLSFPHGVKPYDSDALAQVNELSAAISSRRRKLGDSS